MEVILGSIVSYIGSLTVQYPALVGILAIAYIVGLVLKSVFTALEVFVKDSPSVEDDSKLAAFKASQVGKIVLFIMDLLIRFKVK